MLSCHCCHCSASTCHSPARVAGPPLQVVLLGLLSFVVFVLERGDLASRLGIVVTLFLAMAAVQFVIGEGQPASSYVLPTQWSAIISYLLLSCIACESIVVSARRGRGLPP